MSHEADARKSYILLSLNSKLRSRVLTSFLIHSEERETILIKHRSIKHKYGSIGKRGHGRRTTDAGHRTNDGKDGQGWKRRTNDGKDGQRWKRRTNDGKDGQMMEKTDKRWKRRTNDGKDGQTMEKTDKRWKRRTNDGKDGQTMEKTDNDGKDGQTMKKTRFLIDRPFMNISAQMSVFVIFTAIFTVIFTHCGRA